MDFQFTPKVKALEARLNAFMDEHIYPNEHKFNEEVAANRAKGNAFQPSRLLEDLKAKARVADLWNLFTPHAEYGLGLTNLEYAPLCEIMGRVLWAPEVFNCNAPDVGNMETFILYGTPEQNKQWLQPLLEGKIRSAFAMTEPAVASSDATNIQTQIRREGDQYVINGRKWWTTNAPDPRCEIFIVMGKSDPDGADRHKQQSMILVPRNTPGLTVLRPLTIFGYDDAPRGHGEVLFDNVRVPASNMLLGEGRGFEIAQGRLGPGRIHHCMRAIGQGERALEKMCRRLSDRTAFGRKLSDQTVWQERIADSRIMIDQARLLVLNAADRMDRVGNKAALKEIGMIKVIAPNMLCQILDWAIQAHGGGGLSEDFGLAEAYARARILRIVDGPDEVHRNQIAKLELRQYREHTARGK